MSSCFNFGCQQSTELRAVIEEQKSELERLCQENKSLADQIARTSRTSSAIEEQKTELERLRQENKSLADQIARTSRTSSAIEEQKTELERLRQENKSLADQIARTSRTSSAIEEQKTELERHRLESKGLADQIARTSRTGGVTGDIQAEIRKQIEEGSKRRTKQYVESTFNTYKDKERSIILATCLGPALRDLGVPIEPSEIDNLLKSRDLNNDGGLDFQEFSSLVSTPSPIEEWVGELPVIQLVSDALPRAGGTTKDQLRYLSKASPEQLEESCESIKEYLLKVLQEGVVVLKESYDKLDKRPAAASNSKFQISEMSVGTIADYHEGLSSRIGKCTFIAVFLSAVFCVNSHS
jgi:cell division protein FtsB